MPKKGGEYMSNNDIKINYEIEEVIDLANDFSEISFEDIESSAFLGFGNYCCSTACK